MDLILLTPVSSCSSSSRLSSTITITASPIPRLLMKPITLPLQSCNRGCVVTDKRGQKIVKASSEIRGLDSGEPQSESDDDEEDLLLDKMPLDSKLQQKLEHKMRMKFSKKIRLRGKKLGRSRRMRKKVQQSPSNVNKLKNV